jgi:3-hydroxyacyl-[acyl-carrier-protein] dehydratase
MNVSSAELKLEWRGPIRIEADHPSLPGHFPGQPLVAGVILLEQVAMALRQWKGMRLARVVEAKFLAPLEPSQDAELVLSDASGRARFEIRRGDVLLARGLIEGAA